MGAVAVVTAAAGGGPSRPADAGNRLRNSCSNGEIGSGTSSVWPCWCAPPGVGRVFESVRVFSGGSCPLVLTGAPDLFPAGPPLPAPAPGLQPQRPHPGNGSPKQAFLQGRMRSSSHNALHSWLSSGEVSAIFTQPRHPRPTTLRILWGSAAWAAAFERGTVIPTLPSSH